MPLEAFYWAQLCGTDWYRRGSRKARFFQRAKHRAGVNSPLGHRELEAHLCGCVQGVVCAYDLESYDSDDSAVVVVDGV